MTTWATLYLQNHAQVIFTVHIVSSNTESKVLNPSI